MAKAPRHPMRGLCVAIAFTAASFAQDRPTTAHAPHPEAATALLERLGFERVRRESAAIVLRRADVIVRLRCEPESHADGRPLDAPLGSAARPLLVAVDDPVAAAEVLRAAPPLPLLEAVRERRALPSGATEYRARLRDGFTVIVRSHVEARSTNVALPASGELNAHVLTALRAYPTDGTHRYHWPKSGSWKGNTKDLEYAGTVFERGDPEQRAYCCGLTFEVFLDAWRAWCAEQARPWRIGDLDVDGVRALQRAWFGSAADRSCLHTALVAGGLGHRITDLDEARPGDFVQLWRANGSGHSVVFLGWERDAAGRITGIRYWSTQPSTDGIGERVEWFDARGGARRVRFDELWLCRAGVLAPARGDGR